MGRGLEGDLPKVKEIIDFLKSEGRHKSAKLVEKRFGSIDKTTRRVESFIKIHTTMVGHGKNASELTRNVRVVGQVLKAIEAIDGLYINYEHVSKNVSVFQRLYIGNVIQLFKDKGSKPRWVDYSKDWVMERVESYLNALEKDTDRCNTELFYEEFLKVMMVRFEMTGPTHWSIARGSDLWNYLIKSRKLADKLDAPYFLFVEAQVAELEGIGFTPSPRQMCTRQARERWNQWYNKHVKNAAGMTRKYVFDMKRKQFDKNFKEMTGG